MKHLFFGLIWLLLIVLAWVAFLGNRTSDEAIVWLLLFGGGVFVFYLTNMAYRS